MSASDFDPSDSAEEFPRPSAKRRRISHNDEETPRYVLSPPSRVKRSVQAKEKPHEPLDLHTNGISPVPTTNVDFDSLNVAPWLVHSLRSMQIHNPTEIQRSCIPEILKGRDCIGGSRTGTGKTVAFAVPILQKWSEDPFGIYAVVLTPTRELALQIYEQFTALGAPHSLKTVLITGGSDMRPQAVALSRRPHVVVATPGRLADHIENSGEETVAGLRRAKVVVFDEADRLLSASAGMLPDISSCLSILPPSSERLTLLFTATVTAEVRALKAQPRATGRPPLFISEVKDSNDVSPETSTNGGNFTSLIPSTLSQTYVQVPLTHKDAFLHVLLTHLSTSLPNQNIIVFVNRTSTADLLHRTLLKLDHPCTSLHSGLPQTQRNKNLSLFRSLSPKHSILISTDVASRGLDIPTVITVINYDVPRDPVDYVHRVGRTARAGRQGTSITFASQRDVDLVLAIESYVGGGSNDSGDAGNAQKMVEWEEEGVNLETRVVKGRVLKDVGEARMEAIRETESGKDVNGYRRKLKKERKHV